MGHPTSGVRGGRGDVMGGRRICVAHPRVPFLRGGAELHAELLVEALRREGHDVESITLPYVWSPEPVALQQALAWRLVKLSAEALGKHEGVDLVIATKFPSYLVRHPNKVAWVFHQQRELYDLYATPFGGLTLSEADRALRQAMVEVDLQGLMESRALFSNSRNVAARLHRYCGLEARPLYAPPKLYRDLRPGPYGDYLLVVGRLDPLKRLDLTLRSVAAARRPLQLRIAGRGPHRQELERLATELGIQERVRFLGYVSDEEVVDLYAGCFAVVLTPHDEDYGFTTLEAFFAGKPVVTVEDAGGVLEFVEDGVTGFVTRAEPEAIAQRLETLHDDRALCETLGLAGRARVRDQVSWEGTVEALTATLE